MGKRNKVAGGAWRMKATAAVTLSGIAVGFSLVVPGALAQVVHGGSLPTTPVSGTNWVLEGDANISAQITMPTQTTMDHALTITAASGGSRITFLSPLSTHAFSSLSASTWINLVGNVTFDGTGITSTANQGSLIHNSYGFVGGTLYLGTNQGAGDITITGITTSPGTSGTANGGAIYSINGHIVIGNGNGNVTLSGNTTNSVAAAVYTWDNGNDGNDRSISIYGKTIRIENNTANLHSGAIYTRSGDITIGSTSTDTVLINGNTAKGSGGAIQAYANQVLIDGATITLSNNSVTGIEGLSTGSGGVIMGSMGVVVGNANSNVTITGNSAVGKGGAIYASNTAGGSVTIKGKTINLSDNTIKSGGAAAYIGGGAIYANHDIILDGNTITLTGNNTLAASGNGNGGALEADFSVAITGSMLAENNQALGNGGVIWTGNNVSLNATGDITFQGNTAGGDGGAIRAGGDVTLNATGGNILFKNNTAAGNGDAIWFHNSKGSASNNAKVTFNAAAGKTIAFYDSIANDTDTIGITGSRLLTVDKTGGGAVVFDSANATIYGTTNVQAGAFVVRNTAVYGILETDVVGATTGSTSFTVTPAATLAGGGNSGVKADQFTLQGTLNISGSSLNLQNHPAVGNASGGYSTFTLTTASLTEFTSGSEIRFNTYLNDASRQLSDQLVLDLGGGATTGTAAISVNNTGGAGALTTGNGIMLVSMASNSTSNGAFVLGRRAVAGPYEYSLYQGTSNDPNNQNWFLRSNLDCTQPQNAAICTHAGGNVDVPHYRDETSIYAALPSMALLYGLNLLDTLHERVGEEEDIRGRTDLHQKTPKTGGWGRIVGIHGKQNGHSLGIYGNSPKYDYDFVGFQVGQDLRRVENDDGTRNHLGVYFAYGYARGHVTHILNGKRGTNKFHAYTLGGYWTHFGETGWYVDSVLQGTYYDTDSSANSPGISSLNTHGLGLAFSVESGKPYRFDKGYFIEPQAQLIYQTIDMDSARDIGGKVRFSNADSLVGRIGARFGRTWPLEEERKMTAWIRPNIWHEFRGKPVTKFDSADHGPVPFRAHLNGTWGEINIGGSRQTSRNVSLFLNASYNKRFDGEGYAYDGKFGIRVNW